MRPGREGVTIIEVLMVVVILAILAAIAYPRFATNPTRRATYDARATLEQLREAEQRYFGSHRRYSADLTALEFTAPSGVQVTVGGTGLEAGTGWSATAETSSPPYVHCYVGVGADSVIGTVHMQNGAVVCP
ncbi:MAG TPA: prepilin-type N-terminal cleavage/methylation domain-containing protein [Gemmatimonadaceae bacterium]|jgi:prepilin-type N-terminal cleavage/methylation domain-containing protein|nr:prepilin-type N-terminal cleavage/methylation domain-containing protein [Gemmatimonadaceae bacterium]